MIVVIDEEADRVEGTPKPAWKRFVMATSLDIPCPLVGLVCIAQALKLDPKIAQRPVRVNPGNSAQAIF